MPEKIYQPEAVEGTQGMVADGYESPGREIFPQPADGLVAGHPVQSHPETGLLYRPFGEFRSRGTGFLLAVPAAYLGIEILYLIYLKKAFDPLCQHPSRTSSEQAGKRRHLFQWQQRAGDIVG